MKITILGTGAMGGLYGALLARAGHDVTLVGTRIEVIDALNERGLVIDHLNGTRETVLLRAALNGTAASPVDLVIVLVKAQHTAQALAAARGHVGPGTLVLTLQNGWGNAERLGSVVPPQQVLLGVTYQSAVLAGPGYVEHRASGLTLLGRSGHLTDQKLEAIKSAFTCAGVETEISDSVVEAIWAKLCLNAVSSPLAALLRCDSASLSKRAASVRLMHEVLREVVEVAHALGIRLSYVERWQAIEKRLGQLQNFKPSMLQDIERRRSTEIDAINGAIVQEGTRLRIPTPFNETVVLLIKALEAGFAGDEATAL